MFPPENEGSDQSISEDEDMDYKWSRNCVSLGSAFEDKGCIGILSQLDTLKDVHKLDCTSMVTIESQERKNKLCNEDDVELPVFNNENHFREVSACNSDEEIGIFPVFESICNSEEEIVSDDEKLIVGSVKCERESILSRANKHTEAFYFNGNSGGSSVYDPHMLGKRMLEDTVGNMRRNEIEMIGNGVAPSDIATEHKSSERSMAELLDSFQEKRCLQLGSSMKNNNIKGTRVKHFPRRNISTLGDRNVIDDDIPKALGSEPSSDGEEIPQVLKAVAPQRTIADQFHEALGSASRNDGRPHISAPGQYCGKLFVNLQHVMLSEKERDLYFLNLTLKDTGLNGEKICIDVRILSSSLEAKLIICHCTLKGEVSFDLLNHPNLKKINGGSTLTVIFNSRVCNDVELDKGNLIRIYPPWKVVNAKENDVVILSRYFSRIGSDQITSSYG